MATIYEIARKLQMPGLNIHATFHPTNLTTRMFNSARRMIATGRIEGNGGAAKIARVVLDSKHVAYVSCSKWGLSIEGSYELTDAAKQGIRDLYEAYIVVRSATDSRFDDDDRKSAREYLNAVLDSDRSYLNVYSKELREQIADAFLENRSARDLQHAQQLLADFEAGKPMPVPIF